MRITGLATGMDVDGIIEATMQTYRIKIDEAQQDKEILEIKQKLYRDVINDSRDFYNKYFDVTKEDSLILTKNWTSSKFESSDSAAVSVTGSSSAKGENYKVQVDALASTASGTLTEENISKGDSITIKMTVDGKEKEVIVSTKSKDKDGKEVQRSTDDIVKDLNESLKEAGIEVEAAYSEFSKGVVLESKEMGKEVSFEYAVGNKDSEGKVVADEILTATGKDSKVTITNNRGEVYNHESASNKVTIDGVNFEFKDVTDEEVRITGTTDVTKIKDKLVEFVNDYNKLMENLNTLTMTKNDSSYKPLTDEEKKEMSEEEIKLWNERVESGQLYKDSNLTRIANSMKSAMSSYIDGDYLEKFGIKPLADYQGTGNGTFVIDEAKLTEALENDVEEVMDFFIGSDKDSGKEGIAQQLKTILYDETVTSSSILIKKAGIEGSSTMSNNELTKQIEEYNEKMEELEDDFALREQTLYSQWATVETMMNELNSQQNSLMSMFQ